MAENKNLKLNDEMLENVTGGNILDGLRIEPGTVVGVYDDSQRKFIVKRDQGPEAIASYIPTAGPLLEPGTRVNIALVGMGKWEIVGLI